MRLAGLERLELPADARGLSANTLSDHIYQVLRDAIVNGILEQHDHLVQNAIAEQLQVSRTPVRDALLRLSQEGVIRSVGARGYVVEELRVRDILNIYEVRQALEVQAADLAFDHVTDAHVRELRRLNEKIANPAAHSYDYYDLNREFHSVLTRGCPNELIQRILEDVWNMPVSQRVFKHHMSAGANLELMVKEHASIADALEQRNRRLMLDRISEHLQHSSQEARQWVGESLAAARGGRRQDAL